MCNAVYYGLVLTLTVAVSWVTGGAVGAVRAVLSAPQPIGTRWTGWRTQYMCSILYTGVYTIY